MDEGHVRFYSLTNISQNGNMPHQSLVLVTEEDFEVLTAGVTRKVLAQGADQQIDLFIRTWRNPSIKNGLIAVISDSDYDGQYRVNESEATYQHDSFYRRESRKSRGLKTTDITMQKLENYYDIDTDEDPDDS